MNIVTNRPSVDMYLPGRQQSHSNGSGVKVEGNLVSWPDDGWYEVQSSTSYNTLSEGQRSTTLPHGTYNIINHTTGERFKNVIVGPDTNENQPASIANTPTSTNSNIVVTGNQISWPDDGWYEVQVATNFETVSEGGQSATVSTGTYTVINHTTGEKFKDIVVSGGSDIVRPIDLPPTVAVLPGDINAANAQFLLNHVEVQSAQKIGPSGASINIRSVQFLDGRKASLIDIGPASAFVVESDDGTREIFSVDGDGNIGKKLSAGESITASAEYERDVTLTIGPDGSTFSSSPASVWVYGQFINHSDVVVNLADTGNLSMTTSLTTYTGWGIVSGGTGGTTTVQGTETVSLWSETTLVDATGPNGVEVTSDSDLFNFYKSTPEGQAIIQRESGYYTTPSFGAENRLFVARVKYNRGEGGVELFTEFMPDRTALLSSPDELDAYDQQLARVLQHVQANSIVSEDGRALDRGMQFIIASGVAEAIGNKPSLVEMVLDDLDRGWRLELEASYGGLYTMRQPIFQSVKSKIHFEINTLLHSYARPNDVSDVVAHELAHSLDGYRTDETDGIPGGMPSADVSVLINERNRLSAIFSSTNDTSGLDSYAFENSKEFWAEISQYYLSGTSGAAAVAAASPLLHGILVSYYD